MTRYNCPRVDGGAWARRGLRGVRGAGAGALREFSCRIDAVAARDAAACGSDALERSSDALCTALQLTNFWQDFGRDWRAGRLYVPRDVQAAVGADERQLSTTMTETWARAIERAVAFTRERFAEGRAV